MNFARLNHILIPADAEGRERARRSLAGRLLAVFFWFFAAASPEGRAAILLSLLVGGLGLEVAQTNVYLVWCVLVGVLASGLLARRWFKLSGVSLQLDVPKRVTVGEEVRFAVNLSHKGTVPHQAIHVSGPYLPWDGNWVGPSPWVASLAPGQTAQVQTRAVFRARGPHHLEAFTAALAAPLGLFFGPGVSSDPVRFLVVPKLARIARLETPTVRRYQPGGIALASKTGESMDLLGVRPYRPGDPVRDLHARTWARIGVPAVREYQEEYFTRLGVIVDTDLAKGSERQFEAALSLAAGVVAHLSRGEALIDLLVVGDTIHTLTLGRSLGFLEQALDLLACVRTGGPLHPDSLAQRLAPHLPRLSCLVLVALRWDAERAELVDRVQGYGVGCRTLVVLPPVKRGKTMADPSQDRDLLRVPTEALERGEPLLL